MGRVATQQAFSTEDITDATLATVLGFMGLFLWLASIARDPAAMTTIEAANPRLGVGNFSYADDLDRNIFEISDWISR